MSKTAQWMSIGVWALTGCLGVACDGSDDHERQGVGEHGEPSNGHPELSAANADSEGKSLRAEVSAVGLDGLTTITVRFPVDAFPPLAEELATGDVLTAQSGDELVELEAVHDFGEVIYQATLSGDRAGKRVVVELESGEHGFASAVLTLPEKLTLTSPSGAEPPVLQGSLHVTWSSGARGDQAEGSFEVVCPEQVVRSRSRGPEDGAEDVEVQKELDDLEGPCVLTVAAERHLHGVMEGSWYGEALGAQRDERRWSEGL